MTEMKTHWSGFLNALGKTQTPISSNNFETTSSKIGVSGFMDIQPTNPTFQARYDAMSGSWEGVEASEKAILNQKITSFMPFETKK